MYLTYYVHLFGIKRRNWLKYLVFLSSLKVIDYIKLRHITQKNHLYEQLTWKKMKNIKICEVRLVLARQELTPPF